MTKAKALATASMLFSLLAADGASGSAPAPGISQARFVPNEVVVRFEGQRFGRAIDLPAGVGAREAARALRASERVRYATPNHIARASAWIPNDTGAKPGRPGRPGDWVRRQWGFLPWRAGADTPSVPGGIDAIAGWRNLIVTGRPGAQGVRIAILDTGIAYRSLGRRFRRSPDFSRRQFVRGFDFVGRDRVPLDHNGHGTHVAGTIGERTNNRLALTGLAYRAKLMPVRVLNASGAGRADDIAKGIRFAATHGAQVINMSFNFACGRRVPIVDEAIRFARRKGVVLVASVGNRGAETCVSPPATSPGVIGVGGTTRGACLGAYSLSGADVDLVAPGGGRPAGRCPIPARHPILQLTMQRGPNRFGFPRKYVGTSMAAAHVSGVAAMVIAAGTAGEKPTPVTVENRLRETARDLGPVGVDPYFGSGLIDAGLATSPDF